MNNFAVFILTHGRADNVRTFNTLKRCKYSGKIYLIVDNEDREICKYQEKFGTENVIIFNKKEEADNVDEGNNFDDRRCILHARNACFKIAENLDIEYFLQLDDDYGSFDYKLLLEGRPPVNKGVKNINKIFELVISYYKTSNFKSIALAQGGDFIGGLDNGKGIYRFSKRKCMNTFFCSTKRPFKFVGALNEDVNAYVTLGSRGDLFLTVPFVCITQAETQSQKKGMTDSYSLFGTYCKSFTSVLMQPSSVKVAMMKSKHTRLHHTIDWTVAVPVIINEKYKKQ